MQEAQLLKILLVGDQETGKSSILHRYADDTFDESYKATVGVEFISKNMIVSDKPVQLQIWDTAGQERYQALSKVYFKGSSGVFVVFDFFNRQSFENLDTWFEKVKNYTEENVTVILIGNKSDMIDDKSVTLNEARKYAEQKKIDFFEVSAQQQFQIDIIFTQMAVKVLSKVI